MRRLIEPTAERLGWEPAEGEDDLTRKLRGTLLRTLGTTGRQGNARERARRVVDRLLESPESVDPDVAVAAVYVTASAGTEDDYQRFYERYKNATDPQEEGRFMYALPEFEHRAPDRRDIPDDARRSNPDLERTDGDRAVAGQRNQRRPGLGADQGQLGASSSSGSRR